MMRTEGYIACVEAIVSSALASLRSACNYKVLPS